MGFEDPFNQRDPMKIESPKSSLTPEIRDDGVIGDIMGAENSILFGTVSERKSGLEDLRAKAASNRDPEFEAAKEFFEAVVEHEKLDALHDAFLPYLERHAPKHVDKLSSEQVESFRNEYFRGLSEKGGVDIEALEDELIGKYEKAASSHVRTKYVRIPFDPALLSLDIRYRKAARMPDGPERDEILDGLEGEMRQLASIAPNPGLMKEVEVMMLMRSWLRESGRSHHASVSHTLPVDDMKFGVDIRLTLGDKVQSFDLKALKDDGYTDEYQGRIESGAREKAAVTGGTVVRIEPETIRSASAGDRSAKNLLVRTLATELSARYRPSESKKAYNRIRSYFIAKNETKHEEELSGEDLEAAIAQAVSVKDMRELGLLDGVSDHAIMAEKKKVFISLLSKTLSEGGFDASGLGAKTVKRRKATAERMKEEGWLRRAAESMSEQ